MGPDDRHRGGLGGSAPAGGSAAGLPDRSRLGVATACRDLTAGLRRGDLAVLEP